MCGNESLTRKCVQIPPDAGHLTGLPICNYPTLTDLNCHLTTVDGINVQERKCLLAKAHFAVLSMKPDQPQPSIPIYMDSTPPHFCNSFPET